MKLLHLDSSILGAHSTSRLLTAEVVEAIQLAEPSVTVTYRDLAAPDALPLDAAVLGARSTPADQRTPQQAALAAQADAVIAEFLAADTIVLGAPMYNFTVPTQLKAWIDQVAVAGVTFRYGPNGPEGLAKGKRVVIVATAGGLHKDQPSGQAHVGYLKQVLGFLGITDIRVITAEGLGLGPDARDAALVSARKDIATV